MKILAFSDWRVQDIENFMKEIKSLDYDFDIILYAGDDISRFNSFDVNYLEELANSRDEITEKDGRIIVETESMDNPLANFLSRTVGTMRLDGEVNNLETKFQGNDKIFEKRQNSVFASIDVSEGPDKNYFEEIAKLSKYGLAAIAGNDDPKITAELIRGEDVYNLHESPVEIGDHVFLGQEGSIADGIGYLLYPEEEIRKHLEKQYLEAEKSIPLIVSHTPPKGILDIGLRFGQQHIGSSSLRKFIEEKSVPLTICGHCHQFGGRAAEGDFGTVINIASSDSRNSKGRYVIIDLSDEEVSYEFHKTEEGVSSELLRLSQVGSKRIEYFENAGIKKLSQVKDENKSKLLKLSGVGEWHVNLWLEEAEAICNDEIKLRNPSELNYLKDDNNVLIDIETDLKQEKIWLVGAYSYQKDEFIQLFEKDDEEQLIKSFLEYIERLDKPRIVYFGGNYFDEECLKDRMEVNGFRSKTYIFNDAKDLGIEIQNNLLGKFRWFNLEHLSDKIVNYEYKHPELDGFGVGSKYTKYILDGKEPNWKKLLEYNKDDVMALKVIVDKIRLLIES